MDEITEFNLKSTQNQLNSNMNKETIDMNSAVGEAINSDKLHSFIAG